MFLFSFPPLPICCCCQLCFLLARVSNLSLAIQFTAVFLLLMLSSALLRGIVSASACCKLFLGELVQEMPVLSVHSSCSFFAVSFTLAVVPAVPRRSAVTWWTQGHWACGEVPWWSSEGLDSLLGFFIYDLALGCEVLQASFLLRDVFSIVSHACPVEKFRIS